MKTGGISLKNRGALSYYSTDSFEDTKLVSHAFTTCMGGVSEGCYASMNLGAGRGDEEGNVLKNFDIICEELGIKKECLVLSKQTHSDVVHVVGKKERGNGLLYPNIFTDADAYVTDEPGVGLVVFMADCVPLLFLDPKKKVIAACHSGWRGTLQQIARKTVEVMQGQFGCRSEDILCGIGQSIGPCCFEVGQEVVSQFRDEYTFLDEGKYIFYKGGGKYHMDLRTANTELLIKAGLREANISVLFECTCCGENYFSHRRSGDMRGAHIGLICLL